MGEVHTIEVLVGALVKMESNKVVVTDRGTRHCAYAALIYAGELWDCAAKSCMFSALF